MPAPKSPGSVELAWLREQPIAQIATGLGFTESGLRRGMEQADLDEHKQEGLTSGELAELVRLRRDSRMLEMEVEILERASVHLTRTSSWNDLPGGP